ncbi:MAG: adenine phosphoribosyltransferase [Gammaproteobacteria bacterium]|jgi:adenine phosphoribosyltransferase
MDLKSYIRDIPDFPKPGILFRDITPLLADATAFGHVVQTWTERYRERRVDVVVGIESRGFLFGAPLALNLGRGFVPMRKVGKLPAETVRREYSLEYGTAALEIHRDALRRGDRVVVVDDLLATGGTAAAAAELVAECGAEVVELAFVIELVALGGAAVLGSTPFTSLLRYEADED